jgi:hypothetical protein
MWAQKRAVVGQHDLCYRADTYSEMNDLIHNSAESKQVWKEYFSKPQDSSSHYCDSLQKDDYCPLGASTAAPF